MKTRRPLSLRALRRLVKTQAAEIAALREKYGPGAWEEHARRVTAEQEVAALQGQIAGERKDLRATLTDLLQARNKIDSLRREVALFEALRMNQRAANR